MTEKTSPSTLARFSWIPLASLIGIEVYASGFDGRGAWATGPLFLIPLVLSVAIAGAGVAQCFLEVRARTLHRMSVISTLVALIPLLWLLVRRHFV